MEPGVRSSKYLSTGLMDAFQSLFGSTGSSGQAHSVDGPPSRTKTPFSATTHTGRSLSHCETSPRSRPVMTTTQLPGSEARVRRSPQSLSLSGCISLKSE